MDWNEAKIASLLWNSELMKDTESYGLVYMKNGEFYKFNDICTLINGGCLDKSVLRFNLVFNETSNDDLLSASVIRISEIEKIMIGE